MSPQRANKMLVAMVVLLGLCGSALCQDKPKLLIFMVDGARWNYTNEDNYPGFSRLAEEGVHAERVVPIFPGESYPNYYSIATGLYAESHGFIANQLYSEEFGDMFKGTGTRENRWWQEAEPLWVTAEKAGLKTAMHWWEGCRNEIRGVNVSYCLPYSSRVGKKELMDTTLVALDQLKSGEYNMAMIYYEPVDLEGTNSGPDSQKRKQKLRDFDDVLLKTMDKIKEMPQLDDLNLVVLGDHGMVSKKNMTIIYWESYINTSDIAAKAFAGTHIGLVPVKGREEAVYQAYKNANITGLDVYWKKDIPEKYHYKNGRYVLPILIVAQPGYSWFGRSNGGIHGWDPADLLDMQTIFYASGPLFKKGFKNPPIKIVDEYNMLCTILNIEPLPNNGTWSSVQDMLVKTC